MELPGESQGADANALQVRGQRLHFSPRIRQVPITEFRRHNSAALDSNLEPFEGFRDLPQGIVGAVQAVEPAGVILFIETLGPQEQVEIAKRAMNFDGSVIRVCRSRAQDGRHPAGGFQTAIARRVRRCAALTVLGWQCGSKSQKLLHKSFAVPALSSRAKQSLPNRQATVHPQKSSCKSCRMNAKTQSLSTVDGSDVTNCHALGNALESLFGGEKLFDQPHKRQWRPIFAAAFR